MTENTTDKQREKLIELLRTPTHIMVGNTSVGEKRLNIWEAEKIADNLLANGVIVPPCKWGDKFYRVVKRWQGKTATWERKIDTFIVSIISYNGEDIILENDSEEYIWLSDIGKTVFLSRELAEEALNEQKKFIPCARSYMPVLR